MPLDIPGYTYVPNGYYTMDGTTTKRDITVPVEVGAMLKPIDPEKYPTVWGEKKPIGQQLSTEALLGLAGAIGGVRNTLTTTLTELRTQSTLREYRAEVREHYKEIYTQAPAPEKGADFGGLIGGIGIGAALVAVLLLMVGMKK